MKPYLVPLSLFLCLNIFAQNEKSQISGWNTIGESEPSQSEYVFSEKCKLFYYLSNDNTNIFIRLKITDPVAQSRVLKEGLTLWIDMDRKSVKNLGVRFPFGSKYISGNQPVNVNLDGSIATPLSLANTIELIGFSGEDKRRFPSDNSDSFRGSVKFDDEGILHYLMIMPIAKLPLRNSKNGLDTMPFTIGIEYGAPPEKRNPGNMASSQQSSRQQSIGSRGGGSSGGRGGGGGGRGQGSTNPASGNKSGQIEVPPVLLWLKNVKVAAGE